MWYWTKPFNAEQMKRFIARRGWTRMTGEKRGYYTHPASKRKEMYAYDLPTAFQEAVEVEIERMVEGNDPQKR